MTDQAKREIIAQLLQGMTPDDQFRTLQRIAGGVEPENGAGHIHGARAVGDDWPLQ